MCLFIITKRKRKRNSKEKKSRKIDKRKRKMLVSKCSITTKKLWDYAMEMKEGFVLRNGKVYLLSREKREKICEFIKEQLRKRYIRLLKLPQMTSVFFIGKKNGKKYMV